MFHSVSIFVGLLFGPEYVVHSGSELPAVTENYTVRTVTMKHNSKVVSWPAKQ